MQFIGGVNNLNSDTEDDPRFLIVARMEIASILRAIMAEREILIARFLGGRYSFVTALLAIEPSRGFCVIDITRDPDLNERAASSNSVSFKSQQAGVTVQWEIEQLKLGEFQGGQAFYCPLPKSIFKFQRREFFRVQTPILKPVKCSIPLEESKVLEVHVADISVGGVCLSGVPLEMSLETGMEYDGCKITLPDLGAILVTLQVRNSAEMPSRDNHTFRRAGCMFVRLPPGADSMIQRYIIRLERERRTRGG
ncbi:MAG: flagellar brake protein [Betaproteobacteria bacterium]